MTTSDFFSLSTPVPTFRRATDTLRSSCLNPVFPISNATDKGISPCKPPHTLPANYSLGPSADDCKLQQSSIRHPRPPSHSQGPTPLSLRMLLGVRTPSPEGLSPNPTTPAMPEPPAPESHAQKTAARFPALSHTRSASAHPTSSFRSAFFLSTSQGAPFGRTPHLNRSLFLQLLNIKWRFSCTWVYLLKAHPVCLLKVHFLAKCTSKGDTPYIEDPLE